MDEEIRKTDCGLPVLQLALKRRWFEEIKAGTKRREYRLRNKYWKNRLEGREFSKVVITLGYPPKSDKSRRLEFPWRGYEEKTIQSEEWPGQTVDVFAIVLDPENTNAVVVKRNEHATNPVNPLKSIL